MRFKLLIIATALISLCFKAANEPEFTVEKVVNYQPHTNELKGDVSEAIARYYAIRNSERILIYETRTRYNVDGQITQYTTYRLVQNTDSSMLEKSARINYTYEKKKLVTYESFSFTETGEVPDDSEKSVIRYSYSNAKKASYKAYRYGEFDHSGEVVVLDNRHATETIKYKTSHIQPIIYQFEYNESLQRTRSIQKEIYQGKEESDTTVFIYENGNVIQETDKRLTQNYSYEFDKKGNWTKRLTKLRATELVGDIEREIIYR